jgi:hypothetical protein
VQLESELFVADFRVNPALDEKSRRSSSHETMRPQVLIAVRTPSEVLHLFSGAQKTGETYTSSGIFNGLKIT